MNYVKSAIRESTLGDLFVEVIEPLKERKFTDADWYMNDCGHIHSEVLNSGNGWVSFMHQLVSHLFLKGQDIESFLGLDKMFKTGYADDDDEDFD